MPDAAPLTMEQTLDALFGKRHPNVIYMCHKAMLQLALEKARTWVDSSQVLSSQSMRRPDGIYRNVRVYLDDRIWIKASYE